MIPSCACTCYFPTLQPHVHLVMLERAVAAKPKAPLRRVGGTLFGTASTCSSIAVLLPLDPATVYGRVSQQRHTFKSWHLAAAAMSLLLGTPRVAKAPNVRSQCDQAPASGHGRVASPAPPHAGTHLTPTMTTPLRRQTSHSLLPPPHCTMQARAH